MRPLRGSEGPVDLPELVYFEDLVASRLVTNWTTLNRWIRDLGFPPGRMIGRSRIWKRAEIFAWIESQPTANTAPLKGYAKTVKAKAEARQEGARHG